MEVAFICIPMPDCYRTFMSVVTMERRSIERIPKLVMSDCYWLLCIRDSTLGRTSGLRAGRYGVRILVGAGDFSLIRDFQTVFGAHQHSVQWVLRGFSGWWLTLTSPASGSEVTNEWSSTSFIAAFEGFRVQICTSHPEVLGDFIILSKQMSG
jgi:hypothetical protein